MKAVTVTPPQAAEQLGVTKKTIMNWIHAGRLEATSERRGFRTYYHIKQTSIDKLLAQFKKADQPQEG